MSIEAMKQALEALELLEQNDNARAMLTDEAIEQAWEIADEAITALRAAIAEASGQADEQRLMRRKWFGGRDTGHLSFVDAVNLTMEKLHMELEHSGNANKMVPEVYFEDANGALRTRPQDCQRGANGIPIAVWVGNLRYVPESKNND